MSLKRHIANILVHDDLHKKGKDLKEYEADFSCNICYPKTQDHDHNTSFGRFWLWLQASWPPVEDYSSLMETYYRHFEQNYKQLQENIEDIHTLVEAFKSLGNLFLTVRYRRIPTNTIKDVCYFTATTYNATNGFASESLPTQTLAVIQSGKRLIGLEKKEQDIHNFFVSWWTGQLKESVKPDSDQQTTGTTTSRAAKVLSIFTSTPRKIKKFPHLGRRKTKPIGN